MKLPIGAVTIFVLCFINLKGMQPWQPTTVKRLQTDLKSMLDRHKKEFEQTDGYKIVADLSKDLKEMAPHTLQEAKVADEWLKKALQDNELQQKFAYLDLRKKYETKKSNNIMRSYLNRQRLDLRAAMRKMYIHTARRITNDRPFINNIPESNHQLLWMNEDLMCLSTQSKAEAEKKDMRVSNFKTAILGLYLIDQYL